MFGDQQESECGGHTTRLDTHTAPTSLKSVRTWHELQTPRSV